MTKDFGAAVRNSRRECKSCTRSIKVGKSKYNSKVPGQILPDQEGFHRLIPKTHYIWDNRRGFARPGPENTPGLGIASLKGNPLNSHEAEDVPNTRE